MSTDSQQQDGSVNDPPGGGAAGGDSKGGGDEGGGKKDPAVSYDTHRRVLDEKKRIQAELEQFRKEKSEREQKELEAKGEYQKMLENERAERAKAEAKLKQVEEQETGRRKLGAILSAVGGKIDSKFFGLVPIEDVAVDPDSGEIDAMSVTKAVEKLKATYPEIIKGTGGPKLPGQQPGSKSGQPEKIARSAWLRLSSAEMKKWKASQIVDD